MANKTPTKKDRSVLVAFITGIFLILAALIGVYAAVAPGLNEQHATEVAETKNFANTRTAEYILSLTPVPSNTTVITVATPADLSTPTITPYPHASTASEFLNLYFECVNNARQKNELLTCYYMLGDEEKNVIGSFSQYSNDLWDFRYRYRIYSCPDNKYNVGVEYFKYYRPDTKFEFPYNNADISTMKKYTVLYENGNWSIISVLTISISGCDLMNDANWTTKP
jgi:hypothetical protein